MHTRLIWLFVALLSLGCTTASDVDGDGGEGVDLDLGPAPDMDFVRPDARVVGPDARVPTGNQRPELTPIGDRQVEVDTLLEITLEATDPEGTPVTFNIRSAVPEGGKFNKEEGVFTWTPTAEQVGVIHLMTFEASDGELRDQETITITVVAAGQGGNAAPELVTIGDQTAVEGERFEMTVQATDANGDALTYGLTGDLVDATLDAETGAFAWTPALGTAGESFTAQFTVSDGELEATADVKFVVRGGAGTNLPPQIASIELQTLTVGVPFEFTVEATDDNPDSLRFSIAGAGAPAGVTLDAETGVLNWTPTPDQGGRTIRLIFQVSDGEFRAIERGDFQILANAEGGCVPDVGEANEPIAIDAPISGRSICPALDRDTYTFNAEAGDGITVECAFLHGDGDIDLTVIPPDGAAEQTSNGSADGETVAFIAPTSGEYRVEVYGWEDATNPSYDLSVTVDTEAVACMDDGLDNHSPQTAVPLSDAPDDLQICSDVDDFYSVDLTAGDTLLVLIGFTHADGDIDAAITGPGDYRLDAGSSSDDETLEFTALATGTYTLHVFGYDGAENSYAIAYEIDAGAPCEGDRLEANDSHAASESLPIELYRNLSACGDPDWYRSQIAEGALLQVYVSWDGPAMSATAYTAGEQRIPGQSFTDSDSDGCQAARAHCKALQAPSPGGWVHFLIEGGQVGQTYDINVRTSAIGACNEAAQSCDILSICDYEESECVEMECGLFGGCPDGYACHQDWCGEACRVDGSCAHGEQICKMLDGQRTCGVPGDGVVGSACTDFTQCGGTLDCLDTSDGYCSRTCDNDAQCEGGLCGNFDDGNFCGKPCENDGDCREDYSCTDVRGAQDGTISICTPT